MMRLVYKKGGRKHCCELVLVLVHQVPALLPGPSTSIPRPSIINFFIYSFSPPIFSIRQKIYSYPYRRVTSSKESDKSGEGRDFNALSYITSGFGANNSMYSSTRT